MSDSGRKVLLAMNDSKHSDRLFDCYMKHMYKDDDEVLIVHCAQHGRLIAQPIPLADPTMACRLAREEDEIADFVCQLEKKLQNAGVKGKALRVSGITPGRTIVKVSQKYNVDLIVVGRHHHNAFRRAIMGSVSKYVFKHAHVPVLVCK